MKSKDEPKSLPEGAVVSDPFKQPITRRIPGIHKLLHATSKRGVVFIVLAVIVLAGGVVYILQNNKNTAPAVSGGEPQAYTMSDKDFARGQLSELKNAQPASTASKEEKIAYYDSLIAVQFEAEDYRGVTDSYQKSMQAAQSMPLPFDSYITAAKSYAKLGDKKTAGTVLGTAEAAVKAAKSDADLRGAFLQTLDETKKEIGV